jgi:hypothetical protein
MRMNPTRFLRHVFATRWATRRRFGPKVLAHIETAIRETEALHATVRWSSGARRFLDLGASRSTH